MNNFINLTDRELDKPIFRVLSVNRLFQLFENNVNVLVKPKLWEDPFENYIMSSTGEMENGKMFSIEFRDNFYGQCWSKTRESDGIWRIYSPQKNGARIQTTPRKLFNSLYSQADEFKTISCFIGKVNYYTTLKLKEFLEKNAYNWLTDGTGIGQAQTLLFKRTAFKHENEIRLIYNSNKQEVHQSDLFNYKINATELIDDIVFDPRIEYSEFKRHKKNLIDLGFKKRIVKSTLYQSPKLKFRVSE
jgi:hypothetical protein